jgi:hypothetical protein
MRFDTVRVRNQAPEKHGQAESRTTSVAELWWTTTSRTLTCGHAMLPNRCSHQEQVATTQVLREPTRAAEKRVSNRKMKEEPGTPASAPSYSWGLTAIWSGDNRPHGTFSPQYRSDSFSFCTGAQYAQQMQKTPRPHSLVRSCDHLVLMRFWVSCLGLMLSVIDRLTCWTPANLHQAMQQQAQRSQRVCFTNCATI